MPDLLDHLVTADPTALTCFTLEEWWPLMTKVGSAFEDAIDRTIVSGFAADRLGWAFASGYHHALRRLVPGLRTGDPVALAATEDGGGHPRAIISTLRPSDDGGFVLDGTKRFVTLGRYARRLLVVASTGTTAAGQNQLRLVRVSPDAPGLTLSDLPPTPFAPEIEHAQAVFVAVRVSADDVLPGDGYERYLKPFRTLEDLHVLGAALGHLVAMGRRRQWPEPFCEDALAAACAVRSLVVEPPASAATHLALGGLLRTVGQLVSVADAQLAGVADDEAARWTRDRGILKVADRVRAMRLEAAWKIVGRR